MSDGQSCESHNSDWVLYNCTRKTVNNRYVNNFTQADAYPIVIICVVSLTAVVTVTLIAAVQHAIDIHPSCYRHQRWLNRHDYGVTGAGLDHSRQGRALGDGVFPTLPCLLPLLLSRMLLLKIFGHKVGRDGDGVKRCVKAEDAEYGERSVVVSRCTWHDRVIILLAQRAYLQCLP
jgi:hypothetical protein